MTDPDQLKIAMPVHVAQVVVRALLCDGRRRIREGDAVMARMTAEWLVKRLAEAGYVVMKAEGAAAPSTSEMPTAGGR